MVFLNLIWWKLLAEKNKLSDKNLRNKIRQKQNCIHGIWLCYPMNESFIPWMRIYMISILSMLICWVLLWCIISKLIGECVSLQNSPITMDTERYNVNIKENYELISVAYMTTTQLWQLELLKYHNNRYHDNRGIPICLIMEGDWM